MIKPRHAAGTHYTAHILSIKQSYDSSTGGPLPLQLTLEVPGYATGLAITRDLASARLPVTIHITAVQLPIPEPRRT